MKRFLTIFIFLPFIVTMAFSQQSQKVASEDVTWYSMKEAQQLARENEKKVLVYALAEWCGYCKKMEQEVYPEPSVINTLEAYYYPVMLDIESDKTITFNGDTMTEQQFARRQRVTATPTFFFLNDEGEILGKQPGFIPADVFSQLLSYVGTDAYTDIKFEEYREQQANESGKK